MEKRIRGYKVFDPDWTCRGFQFEVGQTYEEDVKPSICNRGFHFCTKATDCFNYYTFDPNNKVAEVEALGDVDTHSKDTKYCTNKIHIIREITWQEVLELVNVGKGCTGRANIGNYNSGNNNSGSCNSGNSNSGSYNTGSCNSGHRNSGSYNGGDANRGDYNCGDWNKASCVVGCFNTKPQKLRFFDKETDMTLGQWRSSDAYLLLSHIDLRPIEWIYSENMTEEEKSEHPEYKTTGGYLKNRDNTDVCVKWWESLSESSRNIIRSIPNFDAEKFYQITGINSREV